MSIKKFSFIFIALSLIGCTSLSFAEGTEATVNPSSATQAAGSSSGMQGVLNSLQQQIKQVQTSVPQQIHAQSQATQKQIISLQKEIQMQITQLQLQIQQVQSTTMVQLNKLQKRIQQDEMIK